MNIRAISTNTVKIIVAILLLLLVIRMALPTAIQHYVNRTLDRAEAYDGYVGDVDLSLWRGAYQIEDVSLKKIDGSVSQPLFAAERVEFSLLWPALMRGEVVGEVDLYRPEINFVDSTDPNGKQSGRSENWLSIANDLFPLRIDRLQLHDGRVQFHNPSAEPVIQIAMQQIELEARNLANSRELAKDLNASIQANGKLGEQGNVNLAMQLDPNRTAPTFDIDLEANTIGLAYFDDLLNYYAPFDLEAGTLDLAMELASDEGEVTGYAKPVLHNVEVFSWKGDIEEDNDGFWGGLVEMLSGLFSEVVENQTHDQIATNIPIEGNINNPDTDSWQAFTALLHNAFVEAIQARLEGSVELSDVEEKKSE